MQAIIDLSPRNLSFVLYLHTATSIYSPSYHEGNGKRAEKASLSRRPRLTVGSPSHALTGWEPRIPDESSPSESASSARQLRDAVGRAVGMASKLAKRSRTRTFKPLSAEAEHRPDLSIVFPPATPILEGLGVVDTEPFCPTPLKKLTLLVPVKDRIRDVRISELRRPVWYFWSIQNFVMGLLGAIQGEPLNRRFDLVLANSYPLRSPVPRRERHLISRY
ncbi:hypothetical protein PAXRUDRAFT_829025 [Paxillus rubicundulus Ve08.2h10]|uniref:Uncharacterized protein n=1 Tax=Paxillus rubicundulus Ve08.2h10 TaxID=930991 RepID=A0A0D0DVC3_9AGAM|nr:hypothetical protein PAXRUDRAFT_829025 [Paxillus rubicundulus Ve08.2h10]